MRIYMLVTGTTNVRQTGMRDGRQVPFQWRYEEQ